MLTLVRAHLATLGLLLTALAGSAAAESPLVTVGEVTPTGAVLWLRGDAPGPVLVQHGPAAGGDLRQESGVLTIAGDLTAKIPLDGLAPGTRHRYRVVQGPHESRASS